MGLNTLTVLLIQHRCESLESFREGMTPEQRLSEFGPIVGHEIIVSPQRRYELREPC